MKILREANAIYFFPDGWTDACVALYKCDRGDTAEVWMTIRNKYLKKYEPTSSDILTVLTLLNASHHTSPYKEIKEAVLKELNKEYL